jgi:hypothetical protein
VPFSADLTEKFQEKQIEVAEAIALWHQYTRNEKEDFTYICI